MAANGISTLANKEARQIAKLTLAATSRQSAGNKFRSNNLFTREMLPSMYTGNNKTDTANSGGLIPGRPWYYDPLPAVNDDAAWVKIDGWYYVPGIPESGSPGGQSWRLLAPGGMYNDKPIYYYGDEIVRWNGTQWEYVNQGVIILAVGDGGWRPWLATWSGGFTAQKSAAP